MTADCVAVEGVGDKSDSPPSLGGEGLAAVEVAMMFLFFVLFLCFSSSAT